MAEAHDRKAPPYPAKEVENCVRRFLAEEAATQAVLHSSAFSVGQLGTTHGLRPVVDSLVLVEMMIELQPLFPFALTEEIVPPGGYETIGDATKQFCQQLETEWQNHYGEVQP